MAKRPSYVGRRKDANQDAIVRALKAVGCDIFDLSGACGGVPDIACLTPSGAVRFMEIKTDKGKLRPSQLAIPEGWKVAVVRSVDEALEVVGIR